MANLDFPVSGIKWMASFKLQFEEKGLWSGISQIAVLVCYVEVAFSNGRNVSAYGAYIQASS